MTEDDEATSPPDVREQREARLERGGDHERQRECERDVGAVRERQLVLDGRRAWLIAWLSADYIYIKYRKLGRLLAGEKLTHRSWPNPGEA